jgi:hemophore-related protein
MNRALRRTALGLFATGATCAVLSLPDLNLQLIEFTRQSAFSAMGSFNDYFKDHPEKADDLRGIQAPLGAFKDRCGMQIAPTDTLAVLGDL